MIEIVTAKRSKHGLHVTYRVNGEEHFSDFFYNSINFYHLEKRYGSVFVQRMFFHVVAFDLVKFINRSTKRIMWGPFFPYVNRAFVDFWEKETNMTLRSSSLNIYTPTDVETNGTAPLTIDGTKGPIFTVSGRSRKPKDEHYHVQQKTSLRKKPDEMLSLFLSLPVAVNHGIAKVCNAPKSATPYVQAALTPNIVIG